MNETIKKIFYEVQSRVLQYCYIVKLPANRNCVMLFQLCFCSQQSVFRGENNLHSRGISGSVAAVDGDEPSAHVVHENGKQADVKCERRLSKLVEN